MRRVAFTVEPTRVEQSIDYDRLVLDIETDGSISPRDALASAASTLRSLLGLVSEMSDHPRGLELGDVDSFSTGSPDLDLPIEDLDLSERPRICLRSEEELLDVTNFGQKSLDEVIAQLDERGLVLPFVEA